MIASEAQLDELLSRPTEADVAAMAAMDGDLLILGVAGKMGPTLAMRARRAAPPSKRIIGVSRFSNPGSRGALEAAGVETIAADLLDDGALASLPDVPNVLLMTGRKFGSTGDESLTWAMNSLMPAQAAERFRNSRIVAFSSGNIYPFTPVTSGGATETCGLSPIGEYAQSVLARERLLQYCSKRNGTPMTILRLNYAIDMRYGVLLDIGTKVFNREEIDLTMGNANVIWQGDANSIALRSFAHASVPPLILNLTGPETISVRDVAQRFGRHFGVEPTFTGAEAPLALLNNAAKCHRLFGYPSVTPDEMIEWTARWIGMGGATLGKPTHFETRDGKF